MVRFLISASIIWLALAGGAAAAASISGAVTGADGNPVPGAVVHLYRALTPALDRHTLTDGRGSYAFPDVPGGSCGISVFRRGFAAQRRSLEVEGGDQGTEVCFQLEPAEPEPGSLSGTVLRADTGAPVPGAEVSVSRETGTAQRSGGSAITDGDGWFLVPQTPPGEYRIMAQASGHHIGLSRAEVKPGSRGSAAVEILVVPAPDSLPGEIQGRLVTGDDEPLAYLTANVAISGYGGEPFSQSFGGLSHGGDSPTSSIGGVLSGTRLRDARRILTTDREGRFRFRASPGTYVITMWADGFPPRSFSVAVAPGEASEPVTLPLLPGTEPELPAALRESPPREPSSRLRGQVLLPDGTPLVGGAVHVFYEQYAPTTGRWFIGPQSPVPALVTTDAEGRFEKSYLPGGRVRVVAKMRGYCESDPVEVGPAVQGIRTVDLRLGGPDLSLAGRVTAADGTPIAGAAVLARGTERPLSGDSIWYWIPVPRAQLAAGRPWPAEGRPALSFPGAVPGLLRRGAYYAPTDADGRFTLAHLDPGTYQVGAQAPGRTTEVCRDVRVSPGAPPPELRFVLERTGSIEGLLVRPDGRPLAGAQGAVSYRRLDSEDETAPTGGSLQTDREGRWRIDVMAPGSYRVRTVIPGWRGPRWEAVVRPGQTTALSGAAAEGLSLRGRVVLPDGAPAARAPVGCRQRLDGIYETVTALAGADGRFELRGLAPGPAELEARVAGLAPGEARFTLPRAGDLEVRLRPGMALCGRVSDPEGRPLSAARISWAVPGEPEPLSENGCRGGSSQGGFFRLMDTPAGPLEVTVTLQGYETAVSRRDFTGQSGEVDLDVVLTPVR